MIFNMWYAVEESNGMVLRRALFIPSVPNGTGPLYIGL